MNEFHVNTTGLTSGHACVIGPTMNGMHIHGGQSMMISSYKKESGWWAEATVAGRTILGRGQTEETALYDLGEKVDVVYWELLDLRAEISRKASEAMESSS